MEDDSKKFVQHFVLALNSPDVQRILRKALDPSFREYQEKIDMFMKETDIKMNVMEKKMDKFIQETEKKMDAIEVQMSKMLKQEARIKDLEGNVSDLLQEQRACNLVFKGLNAGTENDALQEVVQLVNEKMNIQLNFDQINEVQAFTLKKSGDKCFKFVFRKQELRNKIFKGRLQLGKESPIWVNDDLHPIKGRIAWEARECRKAGLVEKTWVFMGQIFILMKEGDPKRINNLYDLPEREKRDVSD